MKYKKKFRIFPLKKHRISHFFFKKFAFFL